jgi:ankyrin repeat protein
LPYAALSSPLPSADEIGSTLLHHACANNRIDMVSVLLARGAVPNPVNYLGLTPTGQALLLGHKQLVMILQVQGGKKVDSMHENFYQLHGAVMEEDAEKVAKLLAQGMDPSQMDYQAVRGGAAANLHNGQVLTVF